MPVLRLDPDALIADKAAVDKALAWALERLDRGAILIASSATPGEVAAVQSRHGRDAAGHAVEQAFASLASRLVGRGVRRLIVAGGETSGAVVDRLGIRAFAVGPEIAPGVPGLGIRGADPGLGLDHARLRPLGQPYGVGQGHDSDLGPERGGGEDGQEHDRRHAVHAIPRSGSDWEDSPGGVLRQIRRQVPPSHRQDRENGAGTPTGREVRPTTALECRPGYRGLSLP